MSSDASLKRSETSRGEESISFALTGNPNSGKTSVFNNITGANQKTGNWGGVTVDIKTGAIRRDGSRLHFTDIPGLYSLNAYTLEEKVARDFILRGDTDVIINVIDATNLERNLYLGVQLIELGKPVVFAFNMYDEFKRSGSRIDTELLGRLFGTPICFTVGRTGEGVQELVTRALKTARGESGLRHPIHINYGPEIEEAIEKLTAELEAAGFHTGAISRRWYAIKLLEEDEEIERRLAEETDSRDRILEIRDTYLKRVEEIYQEETATLISERRYGFILGALGEAVYRTGSNRISITERIDEVMTNRFLAYPIFAVFMWLLFQATFTLGAYGQGWIERGVELLSGSLTAVMAPSPLRSLLVDGVLGGVGGVLVFLPNILILFFGISILEDTGYMARIAFIMDKLMHRIGLHGKSFIPLIIGVGCNVPAIMAARTLESEKDRVLTILIAPLVTCSARLPVYILFAGAFFPESAGNIIFILYLASFLFAFGIGFLFRKTFFRGEEYPFVMELPPYRIPTLKSSLIHMWEKAKHYLQKMGGVVLAFSVIIWFLGSYPEHEPEPAGKAHIETVKQQLEEADNPERIESLEEELTRSKRRMHKREMEGTYIGQAGRFIEPVLQPLGFDWRMGVSLITGFVAKEVVVSTLGVLYTAGGEASAESRALQSALRSAYSPLTALAFLFFVMLYTPCIVALVTLIREIRSWRWSVFSVVYQIGLAWFVAFLIYQGGSLLGLG
jgi:ferrous iron transport protein B